MTFRTFELHWLGGVIEQVVGKNIADAFSRAGYGNTSLRVLEYYRETKIKKRRNG